METKVCWSCSDMNGDLTAVAPSKHSVSQDAVFLRVSDSSSKRVMLAGFRGADLVFVRPSPPLLKSRRLFKVSKMGFCGASRSSGMKNWGAMGSRARDSPIKSSNLASGSPAHIVFNIEDGARRPATFKFAPQWCDRSRLVTPHVIVSCSFHNSLLSVFEFAFMICKGKFGKLSREELPASEPSEPAALGGSGYSSDIRSPFPWGMHLLYWYCSQEIQRPRWTLSGNAPRSSTNHESGANPAELSPGDDVGMYMHSAQGIQCSLRVTACRL